MTWPQLLIVFTSALSPEIFPSDTARHMMAAVTAMSAPLQLHTEVIGDTTIFYMGVPSALLTISNILWWLGVVLVGFMLYAAAVIFVWNWFLRRRGSDWDVQDTMDAPIDDHEQQEYLRKWAEGRRRRGKGKKDDAGT